MRVRAAATWALGALVPALGAFAFVGSLWAAPTFIPTGIGMTPAAVALVALVATTYALVGALVAGRLPANAIGWLLLGAAGCAGATLAACEWVALGLPAAAWASWLTQWVSTVPLLLVAYVLLLFPDGRLPSRRWRPALWLLDLAVVAMLVGSMFSPTGTAGSGAPNPVAISAIKGTVVQDAVLGFLLLAAAIVVAACALVVRFRGSTGTQRAQLKWLAWAASVVTVGFVFQILTWFASRQTDGDLAQVGLLVLVVCFAAIPAACGVAVTRYRLYDIDRVVSRTVAYLLLTGIVVGVYVAVVTAASSVLPHGASQAVVAAATLAAAAAFEPARRRVQRMVDHRFNRDRYDAQRLVERYADGLRHAVELDLTQRQLVAVVRGAVEPSTIAVWVRPTRQPPS
jgi:hypothetical protein